MNNISLNQVDMYARIINSLLTPTQKFDLVNKILATLRPNSKADEVQKEDIDLNEVLQNSAQTLAVMPLHRKSQTKYATTIPRAAGK